MVADIWNREKQNVNALKIARRGELLYDKFVGFVNDLDELGKALGKATDKYDSALGKLKTGRGNLIAQAEILRGMGLNPSKTLPDKHLDRKSTRLNSSHVRTSYAVFCLK